MVNTLTKTLISAGTLVLLLAWSTLGALAGETLAHIKLRDRLRCGVSEGIVGFSAQDASGRWTGLDVDFCRAVAAAALGSADKVSFVALRASARFPMLQLGSIDLLVRNTTWTLEREATLRVQFAGIVFYDGQGFMVPASAGVTSLAQLEEASFCVEKGTTHERNLADYFALRNRRVKPFLIDSSTGVVDAFFAGQCKSYTSDVSQLAAARLRAPAGQAFRILPEQISKEPLGPVVRRGDDEWLTLVRWVLFALIAAEENRAKPDSERKSSVDSQAGTETQISKALGIDPGWSRRAVQSVGDYGVIFERNLGKHSPLKLERGLNRLWTDGGLMYAPPW